MTGKHPSFSISCLKIFFDLQMLTSVTPNLIHYLHYQLYYKFKLALTNRGYPLVNKGVLQKALQSKFCIQ